VAVERPLLLCQQQAFSAKKSNKFIFFQKYLHIPNICCIFAADFELNQ